MIASAAGHSAPRTTRYSSDAYAYSLPGVVTDIPLGGRANVRTLRAVEPPRETPASDHERTLVITDAACDLPAEWMAQNGVVVLPIRIHVDDWHLVDSHDEFDTMEFFRKDIATAGIRAQSEPLTPVETRDFVQSQLGKHVDFVLEIAIAASRSKIYMNSLAAAQNLMLMHGRVRRNMGVRTPFKMWVVDSETVFAGQGVLVAETVRQLKHGCPVPQLVNHIDTLRHHVHTLVVPKDLFYIYSRARTKGDNSLNWFTYNVGKMFDVKAVVHAHAGQTRPVMKVRGFDDAVSRVMEIACTKVREGLLTPTVCVSYAGDTQEVTTWPSYLALKNLCARRGVELLLSTMSMTGGLNVGAGALSIAFATDKLDL